MRIKKNDNIIVIAGKDKGKTGKVLRVFPPKDQVLVEGVNKLKKNQRAAKSGQKGQIIEKEFPIHVSNVAFIDPKTKKATRIGKKEIKGKMLRVTKKSGTVIN